MTHVLDQILFLAGPTLVIKQAAICIALRKKKIPLVGARMKAKGIMHN